MPAVPGSAVVVLSARLGPVLPAAALAVLRAAAAVYADEPFDGALPVPSPDKLAAQAAAEPVVLITLDASGAAAAVLVRVGAEVITVVEPAGAALLDAVAVMDRLRSPGGCPWDAEQTHSSLRQYLVEEAYELLDAIEQGERAALREELGDVLLQVLFHARIAAEHEAAAFDVDGVASGLVQKLVSRHPHVFAGSERLATAADQEIRWEELKREEKRRGSAVDGLALGQPAVALASKLASRARRAGLPVELLPGVDAGTAAPFAGPARPFTGSAVPVAGPARPFTGSAAPVAGPAGPFTGTAAPVAGDAGRVLFAVAALARLAGHDPESELRAVALRFAADLRAAEDAARAAGLDPAALTAQEWRRFFPGPFPRGATPG